MNEADQLEHLQLTASIAGMTDVEIVLPTDRTVSVAGLNLHLVDWGNSHKPTILFLHGVGLTARTWDIVCLDLRRDYHCVALDLRGHGDSDWAEDKEYGIYAHGQDLTRLVDHLQLQQFILVGHSLGGMVALSYAGAHSQKLAALVIVDTGPADPNRSDAAAPARRSRVFEFMAGPGELDSVEDFVERAVQFNPKRDRRLLRRSLLHNLRQLPDGHWTWKYDRGGILGRDREKHAAARKALWDIVPNVSCPTLVLRGGRSEGFSDVMAQTFAERLPHGTWQRIEDAGHTIQGDNPRGLVEAVRPFLAGVQQSVA